MIPSGPRIVKFDPRVQMGLPREVADSESGGILLGRRRDEQISIEDFEPVPCEHRFGEAYILSDEDLRNLEESVEWFREQSGGLEVLGFYRSAAAGALWNDLDLAVMRRFFGESGSLLLMLTGEPSALSAEVFSVNEGMLEIVAERRPFPVDEIVFVERNSPQESAIEEPMASEAGSEARPPAEQVVEAVPPEARASETRPSLPPATRPRRTEAEDTPDRSWLWVAALLLLTLAGAVVGYRSVEPPPAPVAAPTANPAAAIVPPVRQPLPPVQTSPAPAPAPVVPTLDRSIQSAIARWQRAVLSGDADRLAACYAPQLERYFSRRNASSAEVRRVATKSVARYGRPAIIRISGLTVTPVSRDRAVATFRRHWQTSGPKVRAGEDQERLTFVRLHDEWKIAAEEQTKVYWAQNTR